MEKKFKGKKMVLAITPDVKFYECFIENLHYLGLETLLLCDLSSFNYKNFGERLQTFIRKTFLGDKHAKNKLKKDYYSKQQLETLNKDLRDFDYGLFIRADLFSTEVIKLATEKTKHLYAYQWDGLKKFKDVSEKIPLFNKFYVFDEEDLKASYNTSLLTNFYFDCYSKAIEKTVPKFDVYYLGSYDNRIDEVLNICEVLYNLGLKLNINIATNGSKSKNKKLEQYPYINILNRTISYKENLDHVANSKIILDILNSSIHKGLSFRVFEALGYDKKLITTNSSIKNYDFYREENFHVYENIEKLKFFIQQKSIEIDPTTKKKYSFTNWLEQVLEIEQTNK